MRLATEKSVTLAELPLEDFQAADPTLDGSVYGVLGVKNAVEAFESVGSTGPRFVSEQISMWKNRLNLSS